MPLTAERTRSRHPFELFFLYVVIATAVVGLASPETRPGSIQEGLGHVGTLIWDITLLSGGVTALLGIFWRERATGLTLESLGLCVAGLATILYGSAALIVLGSTATYAGLTLFAYGLAAIGRARQIRKFLVRVTKELQADGE